MGRLAQYTQIIKQHYPELNILSARFNQDGQYNDVVILNDGLVFRFAKVSDAIKTLRCEIVVQKSLQGRLPLPIPEPMYAHLETEIPGKAFVGYPFIQGVPLWRENFNTITSPRARKRMAVQLGEFLQGLHQVNVDEAIPIALSSYETREEWVDLFDRIQERLYAHMREDARRDVSEHFQRYLDQLDRYGFEPCLRHGDFGTGNIIYDPENLSITGIIDFGGVGLGDPAVDFAGLYISYGMSFYEDCCSVYPQMSDALDRVHFYCGTFALQEALFGIENGDEAAFQAGIAEYI
jgi:aminoglycoside 2''-phosphotransferase